MWLLYAFLSALFAGLTSILAKCGIKKTDSGVATAIRTIVVLVFSWIMVFIVGAQGEIGSITMKTWIFLILSGLATGASWLCYFRALQIGDVNKVVPIDKSSTILSILLAVILFRESISIQKMIFVIMIAVGTFLMITKKKAAIQKKTERKTKWQGGWLVYAVLSAVFASLTSILGKIGGGYPFQSGNGNPYRGGSDNGMGGCFCDRKTGNGKKYRKEGNGIYLSVRSCYGSLLALLLQGAQGRCGECCHFSG